MKSFKQYFDKDKDKNITETPTRKTWTHRSTTFKDKSKYDRNKFKKEKLD